MSSGFTEWTFAANVKSWIDEIIREKPHLPFERAEVERQTPGRTTRSDIKILGKDGNAVLSGEIKFPDKPGGITPYNDSLVQNAHSKADAEGIEYFFTWNVNRFVLWKTFKPGQPLISRDEEQWLVCEIVSGQQAGEPEIEAKVRSFLAEFLQRFAAIITGADTIRARPLDEKFIRMIEAAIQVPVLRVRHQLKQQAKKKQFRTILDEWLKDMGFSPTEAQIDENIDRTANLSCYILLNRIMFYKTLTLRFPEELGNIKIPRPVKTAQALFDKLKWYFEKAKKVSADYETIFDENRGDHYAIISDDLVQPWREVVEQVDGFSFEKLDYDLLGPIYERLVSPEERHKFGQHYTKPEICDIICAFAVRDDHFQVLDPACGGGTFLVRTYARKRYLAEKKMRDPLHTVLLQQIYGIDISPYAAHIATINLATRDLVHSANYPWVINADFFTTDRKAKVFETPDPNLLRPGFKRRKHRFALGKIDAVIGNPPYVRQEDIGAHNKKLLNALVQEEFPGTKLSGRSDYHVYFWLHATSFLLADGYLGFLTSSTWLDATYGVPLQKFILDNFRIVAIMESTAEPWFTGARVNTAVTILQREEDPAKRADNIVPFVQFKVPLTDIIPPTKDENQRQKAADILRDFILGLEEDHVSDEYRVRIVKQEDLLREGMPQKRSNNNQNNMKHSEEEDRYSTKGYTGSKWGIHLRAPDIYFELLRRAGNRLVPAHKIADISRGVTTGCDKFFFVRDVSKELAEKYPTGAELKDLYGVTHKQLKKIALIKAGDGTVHPVERKYLEPEVHRLTEARKIDIEPDDVSRMVLLVDKPLGKLARTRVRKYIEWGEKQKYHLRPSCAGRNPWYDLKIHKRGEIFWSMAHQYRHLAPVNIHKLVCNHNLFDILPKKQVVMEVLASLLNSTIVGLMKILYGRSMGQEGNIKTEVVDVKQMLVPDARLAKGKLKERLLRAFSKMRRRHTRNLVDEFDYADRRELDDAVLELLGYEDKKEREEIRERLYNYLRDYYLTVRHKEKQAMRNRLKVARNARVTPTDIAIEILASMPPFQKFPEDFAGGHAKEEFERIEIPAGEAVLGTDLFDFSETAKDGKQKERLTTGKVRIAEKVFDLGSTEKCKYLKQLSDCGLHGYVELPTSHEVCREIHDSYSEYRSLKIKEFEDAARSYTNDTKKQKAIITELERLAFKS
jgi:type I restriction-modification system DNA methylase subunit